MWYAWFLAWVGRFDEAIAEDMKARKSDPLSPRVMAHLGAVYHVARQYDRAMELYRRTLALSDLRAGALGVGRAYFDKGQYHTRHAEFEEALKTVGQSAAGSATRRAELAGRAFWRGEGIATRRCRCSKIAARARSGYGSAFRHRKDFSRALDDRGQSVSLARTGLPGLMRT